MSASEVAAAQRAQAETQRELRETKLTLIGANATISMLEEQLTNARAELEALKAAPAPKAKK